MLKKQYLYGYAQTLGCRKIVCLASEMSVIVEKL